MFARSVTVRLKPNSVASQQNHGERHPPLLQKQKGFRDEISLVASNGSEVLGSVCGIRKTTPKHTTRTYPEVQKLWKK